MKGSSFDSLSIARGSLLERFLSPQIDSLFPIASPEFSKMGPKGLGSIDFYLAPWLRVGDELPIITTGS